MKKFMRLGVLALTAMALSMFVSCKPKPDPIIAVEGVSICDANDKAIETINLEVGEEITLTAKITPSDATNKTVKWSSSNNKIAEVGTNGKVTGIGAGTATITVTTEDGDFTANVKAEVKAKADEEPEDKDKDQEEEKKEDEEQKEEEPQEPEKGSRITASITSITSNDVGEITISIDENITLTAPKGFDKYTWYIDDVKVKEAEESVRKSKELKLAVDKDTKIITVDGTTHTVEEGQHSVMLIVNDELSATYYLEILKITKQN